MLKWRLDEDMHEMGIRSRTEVFGIFASALPVSARLEAGRWTMRKRQGLVLDFVAAVPEPPQSPADAADETDEEGARAGITEICTRSVRVYHIV